MSCRVLHVVRGSTFYGGPEIYILNAFKALAGGSVALRLAVLAKDVRKNVPICREAERQGLPYRFIPARFKFRLHYVRQLISFIQAEHVDVIHTHEYKSDLFGLVAARRCGIPIVATAHGWTRNSIRALVYERLEAHLLRRLDRVLVGSQFMAEDLIRVGVPSDRIVRVPNSVDAEQFSLGGVSPQQAKARLGVPEEAVLIGTVGRLSKEKGHTFLLKAFTKIRAQVRGAKLLILGTGKEARALRRLSRKLGLDDAILWVSSCPHHRMPLLLRALDLFVLPSLRENQPLVLLEAMAAKIPVVATEVGGVKEIMDNGIEGLLVPPGNSETLAEAMLRAIGTKESSLWIEKGIDKVRGCFSLERFSEDMSRVYSNLT
jgi:glycosyltransferase involved in cell wall biosynthesis